MGTLTADQLESAAEVERAAREAKEQIEQAGRGLFAALQACEANTADINTCTVLAAVIAYVADAQRVLLEVHAPVHAEAGSALVLPSGRRA